MTSKTARRRHRAVVLGSIALLQASVAHSQVLWSSVTGSAWLSAPSWTGGSVPTAGQIAQFGANPTGPLGVGINFAGTTNAGTQVNGQKVQEVGSIETLPTRSVGLIVGNSSATAGASGRLRLLGATVNDVPNVVLRNNSAQSLTIQSNFNTGTQGMTLVLGNDGENVVNADSSGDIVISTNISGSASGSALTFNASGTGSLRLSGNNTYRGGTNITGSSGGALNVDFVLALPKDGTVSVSGGGRLNLNAVGSHGIAGQILALSPTQTTLPALANATGLPVTWEGNLEINADANITANGTTASIAFTGHASGGGSLVKQGTGTLAFNGPANTLTGGTVLNSGTLAVSAGSSMGTGPLTLFQVGTAPRLILNNPAQTVGSLTSQFTSVSGIQSQIITLNGTALTVNQTTDGTFGYGAVTSLTSYITGTGSLIKAGPATLALTALNTFSGPVTVQDGTLYVANNLNPSAIIVSGTESARFSHDAGLKNVLNGNVTLGVAPADAGAYLLSASGTLVANNSYVAMNGTATFTQTGGTHTTLMSLSIGQNPGSSGIYDLQGGQLASSNVYVGNTGAAVLVQTGGTNALTGTLFLANGPGSTGSYNLSNGQINAPNETVGVDGIASVTQTGGNNKITSSLIVGLNSASDGTYQLAAGSVSSVAAYVGWNGKGSFVQSGGSNDVSNILILGYAATSRGSYNLSAGQLTTGSTAVGYSGPGTFTQSGGNHTTGNFALNSPAPYSSTYDLSGGLLSTTVSTIGLSGNGAFTQTGGTHAASGSLYLGSAVAGVGSYVLAGGRLSANNAVLGDNGAAIATQSGGTASFSNFTLGNTANSIAAYTLDDGALSTQNTNIGNLGSGTFTQNGGIHTVSNTLYIQRATTSQSASTYNLNGGQLNANSAEIARTLNATAPAFEQTAGTFAVTGTLTITVGSIPAAPIPPVYRLSGGLLSADQINLGFEITPIPQGQNYASSFEQTGGTVVTNTLTMGGDVHLVAPQVDYTLSGGEIIANIISVGVDTFRLNTFTQTAGSVTATQLKLGEGTGLLVYTVTHIPSAGQYRLQGGRLNLVYGPGGLGFFTDTVNSRLIQTGGDFVVSGAMAGNLTLSGGTAFTPDATEANVIFDGGTLVMTGSAPASIGALYNLQQITSATAVIDTGSSAVTMPRALSATQRFTAGGLTKLGTGMLILPQSLVSEYYGITTVGLTTVVAGTLQIGNGGAAPGLLGDVRNDASFVINRSNSDTFLGRITGSGAMTNSGTGTLVLAAGTAFPHVQGSLQIAAGAIDLTDNCFILRGQPIESIHALLATGALYSSLASANPYTALAIFSNDADGSGLTTYYDTYADVSLLPTDAIVRYTYTGDTNIDGTLDGQDLANLIEGLSTGATGWQNGDFDYDGLVNLTDFNLFTAAYNAYQLNPIPLGSPADLGGSGAGAIPEPATLAAVLPLVALTRRRR